MTDSLTETNPAIVRGTCVEVAGVGVLLRGESGAGKSDLALRLIDDGAGLVSDDYVHLRRDEGIVRASAPPSIAGLLEVRGIGLVHTPLVRETAVRAVVDLVAPHLVPRLPEASLTELMGVALPRASLNPFEASAPAKIRALVRTLAGRDFRQSPPS